METLLSYACRCGLQSNFCDIWVHKVSQTVHVKAKLIILNFFIYKIQRTSPGYPFVMLVTCTNHPWPVWPEHETVTLFTTSSIVC